ncbi:hypothetical protein NE237_022228 [Protea cynaroides]|uniref:Uncharacterized protein n=1 Tax=Protea cynaroides TaxID=273540 RepID=A0A9Q0HEP4_9MAGN|nr:hypothetical protein NE237_022228 [Protea cynaroides]
MAEVFMEEKTCWCTMASICDVIQSNKSINNVLRGGGFCSLGVPSHAGNCLQRPETRERVDQFIYMCEWMIGSAADVLRGVSFADSGLPVVAALPPPLHCR